MKKHVIIDAVLLILFVLTYILTLIFYSYLPSKGIETVATMVGDSMKPTMGEGSLILIDTTVPFADLRPGDIIQFRDPVLIHMTGKQLKMRKTEKDGKVVWMTDGLTESEPEIPTGDVAYQEGETCIHRVAEVYEGAVRTKGDNNDSVDPFYTVESGYIGKVIWYASHIGWFFDIMAFRHGEQILAGVFVIYSIVLMIIFLRRGTKSNKTGDAGKSVDRSEQTSSE